MDALNDLNERKKRAAKETEELLVLYREEIDKITENLKRSGKLKDGLDTNSEAYAAVNEKFDRLMSEVFSRYSLSPGTKVKLW